MIPVLIERLLTSKNKLKEKLLTQHPDSYRELLKMTIELITTEEYGEYALDPERITMIDDGDYQGTLIFVIAEKGYQPWRYYHTKVDYGSCSTCDTFEGIRSGFRSDCYNEDGTPSEKQVNDYFTLALHMVEHTKEMYPLD